MVDRKTLEGVLHSISEVHVTEEWEYGSRVPRLSSKIIISHNNGQSEVLFPGIIFPDSIGKKVRYKVTEIPTQSLCGTPMSEGQDHVLVIEDGRSYYGRRLYDS